MKKRIAILSTLGMGGAENMVVQLASSLNKDKYEPIIITINSKKNLEYEKVLDNMGIKVIFLNHDSKPGIKSMYKMWKVLSDIKPEVIHSNLHMCVHTAPWLIFHNKKLVHTIHSRPQYEFSNRIKFIMKFLYKIKKAVPIAISNTIAKEAAELYGLRENDINVIYNPVDLKKFKKYTTNNKLKLNNINFINVARMNIVKNQELLIRAMVEVNKEVPNAYLTIVGDGELREELEKLARDLKVSDIIKFTGSVNDVPKRLNEADIFVLTSHYEGLPLSILEAMAVGLPIIATDVGGIPDIIDKNGILIQPNNVRVLKEAMIKLAINNELREIMASESNKEIKKYDLGIIANKYECIYEKFSLRR